MRFLSEHNLQGWGVFKETGRNLLKENFARNQVRNLTAEIPGNIDHIVISQQLVKERNCNWQTWNDDKLQSDNIGIMVEVS